MLREFLIKNYLMLVAFNLAVVAIVLSIADIAQPAYIQSLWLTLGYSITIPLAMGILLSASSGFIFGSLIPIGIGLLARRTNFIHLPVALAGGFTGSILLTQAHKSTRRISGQEIAGLLTGGLAAIFLILVGVVIISGDAFGVSPGAPGAMPLPGRLARIITTSAGLAYMIVAAGTISLRSGRRFVDSLPLGAVGGVVTGACYYLFFTSIENSPVFLISAAISGGMLMCVLFASTWSLAKLLGGSQAAALAAALVFGIGWTYLSRYLVIGYTFDTSKIFGALACTLGGISFSIWRPILFIPISLVWNNLLYTLDLRSNLSPLKFFKLHAAFWDEWQFLTWPGLEDYFILQAKRDPLGFEKSKLKFADTSQGKALQAAEVELLARKLENCQDLTSIAGVSSQLQISYSDGEISAMLHTFSQMSHDVESALNHSSAYQTRLTLGRVRDSLNLFQRELILSPKKHTARYNRVTAIWDGVIESSIGQLAREASFQQEIDNPYICGMPLNSQQEVFVGRADIMARLERLLMDPYRPPLHLYGQRRMGKTSLLLNLDHYLPSSIISVFFDGQGISGYLESTDLYLYFINEIRIQAQKQRAIDLPPLTFRENSTGKFAQISAWVDRAEAILADNGAFVLFMVDEFEALETLVRNSQPLAQEYLGLIRFILQHRTHFKLLFVGSHSLDEVGAWATFLFNAQVVKIGRLAPEETMRLIEHPVKNFPLKYVPTASQHILSLTRGHPHLVQSICYELVMLKNEQSSEQRFIVTEEDVEEAAKRTLVSSSFFFVDIRGPQINPSTAAMLDHLADMGPGALISQEEWVVRFPDNFDANLSLALKRDLIEEYNGWYRFQVEMIRRWFAYHPF
ncbi:MAG TPA: hypothetical protein VN364_10845 [Bellilinea sp.]|nr:hypothetical protein [Bellilinea sp.]